MEIANPLDNSGVLLTNFGMTLCFDMKKQDYSTASSGPEYAYCKKYWPKMALKRLNWLMKNKDNPDYEKQKNDLIDDLSQELDLYTFGSVLLYLVSGEEGWNSAAELTPLKIKSLLKRDNKYFHKTIYDRLERIIARCFRIYDEKPTVRRTAFDSFSGIKKTLISDFNYFISTLNNIHPFQRKEYLLPVYGSPVQNFTKNYHLFCSSFYYSNYDDALYFLDKVDKYTNLLPEDYEDWIESHKFNKLVISWMLGNIDFRKIKNESLAVFHEHFFGTEIPIHKIQR